MMVAAHDIDLTHGGASGAGLKTAFIPRPDEYGKGHGAEKLTGPVDVVARTSCRTGGQARRLSRTFAARRLGRVIPAPPGIADPYPPAVEIEIDHRRGVERQHLAEQQPAHDGDAQRLAQFRTLAEADRQRQRAQDARPWWSS